MIINTSMFNWTLKHKKGQSRHFFLMNRNSISVCGGRRSRYVLIIKKRKYPVVKYNTESLNTEEVLSVNSERPKLFQKGQIEMVTRKCTSGKQFDRVQLAFAHLSLFKCLQIGEILS